MERFQSIGAVITILVVVTGFLMAIKVVPFTEVSVGLSLLSLGVARFA